MIKVQITPEQIFKATERASRLGVLRNSIKKGEGNLIGMLGEQVFSDYFGGEIADDYQYDVLLKGKRIEVKTKANNYPPEPHFNCTVANYNAKQKCDYYYFVRIKEDLSVAWLLGGYDREQFFKDATFCKKGEVDLSDSRGFRFTADCYNIKVEMLKGKKE